MRFGLVEILVFSALLVGPPAYPRDQGCNILGLIGKGKSMLSSEDVIKSLDLGPLPGEGGFYKETYRDPKTIEVVLGGEAVKRSISTAIYYMVTPESFSALHRLRQDEVYHFYMGDPAEMMLLHPTGKVEKIILGPELSKGERLQVAVPAGTWQGVRLIPRTYGWSLMGTTVSPGFEFADFELGHRASLLDQFPSARDAIYKFTRVE